MSVGVGELTLAPSAVARVEELSRGRALAVKVQLPAGLPLLTTPQITLDPEGRGGSFGYTEEVAIDAGSEAHMGMIAALSAEDDSHAHVFFTLVITGERKVSRYGIRNHCVTLTSPSAACVLHLICRLSSSPPLLRPLTPSTAFALTGRTRARAWDRCTVQPTASTAIPLGKWVVLSLTVAVGTRHHP